MFTFRKTGSDASRSYGGINNLGVSEGGNDFLCHENFTANRAVLTLGETCFSAGGGNCFVDNFSMTECRNNFLCHKNFTALRTFFAFAQTGYSARGSYRFKHNGVPIVVIMSEFGNGRCFKRITRLAISTLFALFSFCCLLDCIPFIKCVGCLRDSSLCYKNFTTYGAVLSFGKTGSSTSRSYCFVDNFGVTECGNSFLLYKNFIAY